MYSAIFQTIILTDCSSLMQIMQPIYFLKNVYAHCLRYCESASDLYSTKNSNGFSQNENDSRFIKLLSQTNKLNVWEQNFHLNLMLLALFYKHC